mmetsp:Transcript_18717/g.31360  ORF Transcript_18717/g.31360 Transcript_18717/m.31360 type:complete len:234 (-) Transcript_18717:548-1249(-)
MTSRGMHRTNSSLGTRSLLQQNYVVVPEVSSTIAIEKYISFARSSFYYAVRLFRKGDYNRAFVDFNKFQTFVREKLPDHTDFHDERGVRFKKWIDEATDSASQFIEEISYQLDVIEDKKNNPGGMADLLKMDDVEVANIPVPDWIDGTNPINRSNSQQAKSLTLSKPAGSSQASSATASSTVFSQQQHSSSSHHHHHHQQQQQQQALALGLGLGRRRAGWRSALVAATVTCAA